MRCETCQYCIEGHCDLGYYQRLFKCDGKLGCLKKFSKGHNNVVKYRPSKNEVVSICRVRKSCKLSCDGCIYKGEVCDKIKSYEFNDI